MSRDDEITRVASELDALLNSLDANVVALRAILTRQAPPEPGAADERLALP